MLQGRDWAVRLLTIPYAVVNMTKSPVPKGSRMDQLLLHLRDDIFPDYPEKVFLARIAGTAKILKTKTFSASARILVRYERG